VAGRRNSTECRAGNCYRIRLTQRGPEWGIIMKPIEMNGTHAQLRACTVGEIKSSVAYFFGMPVEELHRRSTIRAVTMPRQIAMYLAKQITDVSLAEIGRQFGGMHYTTVMHSIVRVEEQRRTKDGVELAIRIILESIKC
jgi:chromosomal replication initiation ATPase DnaA